jgi:hypothetical protein
LRSQFEALRRDLSGKKIEEQQPIIQQRKTLTTAVEAVNISLFLHLLGKILTDVLSMRKSVVYGRVMLLQSERHNLMISGLIAEWSGLYLVDFVLR